MEVVCEFLFEDDADWDLTIPGLLYERLNNVFPKRRQTVAFSATLEAGAQGVNQRVFGTERSQFWSDDESSLVQVSPHFLAVNHLKPYPGWEHFRPRINDALQEYRAVANPDGLRQVRLNYINRIDFDEGEVEPSEYMDFYPYVGPRLPKDYFNTAVSVQFPLHGGRDILQVRLHQADNADVATVAFILDLNIFLARSDAMSFNDVSGWLEEAHVEVSRAFEGCIKPLLRERFRKVRS